ncbi:hypothetical protein BJY52DRAFT_1229197 [Lactarius psammicola]|nr:hypothetical protein BJY52DRAFT_1229197 [Lactarius psammicola]
MSMKMGASLLGLMKQTIYWMMGLAFSSIAPTGKMLRFSENGRNMPRCVSEEVMFTLLRRATPKQSNLQFPFISNLIGALIFQPSPMQMGYVSGKKKATIPWAKLSQDPTSWIKPECVPDGFQWADPSKLHIGNVFDLLKHWRQRKQDRLEPLIWVSSCPLLKDVEQPSKHHQAPKHRQGHDTNVGGPNNSSDSESSSTSSSDDPSSSNANHSALPNSDDNSTEDEESENFNLKVSPPHSLSSPQASGSFQGGRRYTSTPSSPIDTQHRSTPEMEQTSSPDHILEEMQERQGHDKDYDSGPDDSGTFQSSPQGSFDESDHGKWRVKITERAKYMDTGRGVGGINTHFLQR